MNLVNIFAEDNDNKSYPFSSEFFNSEVFWASIQNNNQIMENKEWQSKSYILFT